MIEPVRIGEGAIDISIPMRFDANQPNAYGVEPAIAVACEYGELVGDTRRGGSCNFDRITFIPHCNGTHTECVGHITNDRISILDCLKDILIPALLISVLPELQSNGDEVIEASTLAASIQNTNTEALVVRTLPNGDSKLTAAYDETNIPPYFSTEAMEFIAERFTHLLVDMPSIDRLYDEGRLSNHRIFWNVAPGTFEIDGNTRINSTITEMIYIPDAVADGEYLLNLQIAPFASDAAPSRPVLLPRL